jgi:hypothetical protein
MAGYEADADVLEGFENPPHPTFNQPWDQRASQQEMPIPGPQNRKNVIWGPSVTETQSFQYPRQTDTFGSVVNMMFPYVRILMNLEVESWTS